MGKHSGESDDETDVVDPPVQKPPPARGAAHPSSIPKPAPARHSARPPSPARPRSAPAAPLIPRPKADPAAPATPAAPITPVIPPIPPKPVRVPPVAAPAGTAKPAANPASAIERIRQRNAERGLASAPAKAELHVPHARQMKILAASVLATVIAWVFLVTKAISFGRTAKGGESAAWVFLFLATVGATACLFLALILGNKLRMLLRGEQPVERTHAGGKRASRD